VSQRADRGHFRVPHLGAEGTLQRLGAGAQAGPTSNLPTRRGGAPPSRGLDPQGPSAAIGLGSSSRGVRHPQSLFPPTFLLTPVRPSSDLSAAPRAQPFPPGCFIRYAVRTLRKIRERALGISRDVFHTRVLGARTRLFPRLRSYLFAWSIGRIVKKNCGRPLRRCHRFIPIGRSDRGLGAEDVAWWRMGGVESREGGPHSPAPLPGPASSAEDG